MAKKSKLTNDELNWILKVDATELQQKIHETNKDTKKLVKDKRELEKAMNDLIASGQKEGQAYSNLEAEVSNLNDKLSKNREFIKECEKEMGVSALTMTQLRKRSRELQLQLDQTSEASSPEEYQKLETQLSEVRSRMDHLRDAGKRTQMALATQRSEVDLNAWSMDELKARALYLQKELDATSKALHPERYNALEKELGDVEKQMEKTGRSTKENTDLMSRGYKAARAAVVAFISVKLLDYLKQVNAKVFETRKEFAAYEAVLRNALQSPEAAAKSMSMLKKFAADTNFQLSEITASYVKLVNRGITPTKSELTNLGDLAANQGKDLDQLVEAQLDAMTGEFERLKEFGIRASKEGDKVRFTFKGVTTEVQFSDNAIKDYIYSLGQLQGVQGSMATQMQELTGLSSNMKDAMDSVWNNLGIKMEPFYKRGLKGMISMLNKASDAIAPVNEKMNIQFDNVVKLERTLPGLIDRYEVLKIKTNLSASEQQELNNVISQVAEIAPNAISAFDQYGNAIDISTQKAKDFIQTERARLAYINKEAIESTNLDIKNTQRSINTITNILKKGEEEVYRHMGTSYASGASMVIKKLSVEREAELKKELQRLLKLKQGANEQLGKLTGKSLDDRLQEQTKLEEQQDKFNAMTKEQLAEYISLHKNAADSYADIAQKIYDSKFKETPKSEKDANKELKDELDLKLQVQENSYEIEKEMLKKKKLEEQQSDAESKVAELNAEKSFQENRIKLLEQYKKKTSSAKDKAKIEAEILKSNNSLIEIERQTANVSLEILKESMDKQLDMLNQTYTASMVVATKQLADRSITQQQYDVLMLSMDSSLSAERLKIVQNYGAEAASLEGLTADQKLKVVQDSNKMILSAELKAAEDRAAMQQSLQNLIKDFKGEFKLTTIMDDTQAQLTMLEAAYQARLEMAKQNGMDTTELTELYEKAKTRIILDEEAKRNQIRDSYGLLSMQQRYEIAKAEIQRQKEEGLLTEEETQQAILNLKVQYAMNAAEKVAAVLGAASDAINALQQAEVANIDAKYDAEIAAASGNAERVKQLEEEKEKAKLEVQSKYADIQFAVKISEIVANTAVAGMKAYADLGPIAGSVAAALIAVTGAAQVAVAAAERKKVKALTSGGSSGGGSGKRVVSGRESGGYIDVEREQDGRYFRAKNDPDKRGYIDRPTVIVGEGPNSKEWVASNSALKNPTVAPLIALLDESQRLGNIRTIDMNKVIRQRLAGYETGGFLSGSSIAPPLSPQNISIQNVTGGINNEVFLRLVSLLERGIKANVNYFDIIEKEEELELSRNIGSK